MRRLQLAAETGRAWGVLFRPACAAQERSPAALRLRLEPVVNGLAVYILKRRGGPVGRPVRVELPQAGSVRRARQPVSSLVHPWEAARDLRGS
jgi:cell division inhibitor SulA/protein ImuA